MTSLDDYWPPAEPREAPPDNPAAAGFAGTPRRHRHVWVTRAVLKAGAGYVQETCCRLCLVVRDEAKARRGKSSRRLGHDGERRSERRYGWSKVGEFGGITDLQGTLAIVQQKTSRRAPPPAWQSIFRALEARAGGRIPLILLSFVRHGVDTEDFIVLRGQDWLALHGFDKPEGTVLSKFDKARALLDAGVPQEERT